MQNNSTEDLQHIIEQSSRFAVVTVCTPDFLPGSLVMVYSFLKYNDWYKGDFVFIIEKDDDIIYEQTKFFNRIRFVKAGNKLVKNALIRKEMNKGQKMFPARFFSIETFNIKGYDKLLYLDSDILITGNLLSLFALNVKMACVGDAIHYKGKWRHAPTYSKRDPNPGEDLSSFWNDNFNSGVLLLDQSMINSRYYKDMVEMIHPDKHPVQVARLHDQIIHNIYLRGQYQLVSAKYNFRMGIAAEIYQKDGVKITDALIIHYTARRKPWVSGEVLHRIRTDSSYHYPFQLWQEAWMELMTAIHEKNTTI